VLLFSLGIAGVAAGDTAPGVTVTEAWIRWLPANLPAGGYLTLRNDGSRTQTLTAVSSTDYRDITLHRTSMQDHVSTMQPVQQVAIPPHQSLSFAANGYHIMLEHATRSLQPGDRVSMTLRFADGSTLDVPFDVRRPDADTAR
jgi:periplasmic copper chaperone A